MNILNHSIILLRLDELSVKISIALYLEVSILLFSENNKMTFAMFFSFRITMHR